MLDVAPITVKRDWTHARAGSFASCAGRCHERTVVERVRALLHNALEQPEGSAATFLSKACHGDEAIRREVESLVEAHAAAGGFLETPAFRVATEVPAAPALQPGDRVGSFEVIGILGRGGMGEVYRARDAKLDRDVAIKVLPRALATDPQRLARFERESRILASFNHPDIAAIHSVEQIDGVPLPDPRTRRRPDAGRSSAGRAACRRKRRSSSR